MKYKLILVILIAFIIPLVCADTTSPFGNKISPINGSLSTDLTVLFQVNETDETALSNVTLYIWYSNSTVLYTNTTLVSGTYNQTNWSYTFQALGTYFWSAKIYDTSSNYNWTYTSNVSALNYNWSITVSEIIYETFTYENQRDDFTKYIGILMIILGMFAGISAVTIALKGA